MEDCPIDNYDQMTVSEVGSAVGPYTNGLEQLSDSDLVERLELVTAVLEYERAHKDRKTAKSSITEVRDALVAEARPRGLLTPDEEAETESDDADDVQTDEEDDADAGDADDADGEDTGDGDDPEPDAAEDESEEGAEDVAPTSGPMQQRDNETREAAFTGADRRSRVLVRNHLKEARRVAGHAFDGGEVKEIVLDDKLRAAIRRNQLQVVKG